jgi:hypothetical protein
VAGGERWGGSLARGEGEEGPAVGVAELWVRPIIKVVAIANSIRLA